MKDLKDYIVPAGILMIICLVVSLALVGTYQVTAPVIAEVSKKQADEARSEVLPSADSFTKATDQPLLEGIREVYVADNGSGMVITSEDKGFGGAIVFMTSFDAEGKIVGVKLLEHKETPGLGTKITNEDHVAQYIGKDNLDGIVAITGATISSNAMMRAEQKAFAQYAKLEGAV